MRHPVTKRILGGAFALLLAGCDGTPPVDEPALRVPDAALLQRIDAAAARIQADTCFREQQDGSACAWVSEAFDPAARFDMADSTGETILIADDFRELTPLMLRYRNRLRGYLHNTADGTIANAPFTWRVPAGLHETLTAFAGPDIIPAEWLRPLSEPIAETYGGHVSGGASHGHFVFTLLVEANPRQPLLLWNEDGFLSAPLESFCDTSATPEALEPLHAHARRKAESLRAHLQAHNVRFINHSRGNTVSTLRDVWALRCGAPAPADDVLRAKLRTEEPVQQVLFGSPGVFAAHAAGYVSDREESPFDFPSDHFPNRLRVGFFTALASGLDAAGRGPHEGLGGEPGLQAVDLYLNSGVESHRPFAHNQTPLLQASDFGTDVLPITFSSTSWMTPLALTRFIHLRDGVHGGQPLTDARIADISEAMVPADCSGQPDGRCRYQDPLRHGHTEAMRLGYRPVEYVEP